LEAIERVTAWVEEHVVGGVRALMGRLGRR
jgi:hypothetical protein